MESVTSVSAILKLGRRIYMDFTVVLAMKNRSDRRLERASRGTNSYEDIVSR